MAFAAVVGWVPILGLAFGLGEALIGLAVLFYPLIVLCGGLVVGLSLLSYSANASAIAACRHLPAGAGLGTRAAVERSVVWVRAARLVPPMAVLLCLMAMITN
jgi:hypothetical protein